MNIIGTIIVGFLVGLIARFLRPGKDKMGFILTTILGIVGAVLGSFLGQALGIYQVGEPAGFIGAILGSLILLMLLAAVSKRAK